MIESDISFGVVMLVHTALDRAEQVARHWANAGCPVVIHVDKNVNNTRFKTFCQALSDIDHIRFCRRHSCEWGSWGLVAAAQDGSEMILREFPEIRHVYLASGACLPLRPISELADYLAARPRTDFIESATISDVPWTVGGLDIERFTFRFPFSWKEQRWLFDKYVSFQRKMGYRRRIPNGIVPHMGSQWWCLTRQTLSAILEDPERATYDRYFARVWIPDESYFQTLVRQYSQKIESRSLTLSKFDFQGKPHIFYDDHLQLLRRSDCFVARKIWPHAHRLYDTFLNKPTTNQSKTEPNPGKIDRIFARAMDRRTQGRAGLYMQSRFPRWDRENGVTASPYSVFEGFTELFEGFPDWLAKQTGTTVHGHLFSPARAEFAGGDQLVAGALSDSAALRDYNPNAFLASLMWNMRGTRQCFQFGPEDSQGITQFLAHDPNAQVSVISGAWAVPLFKSNRNFSELRQLAAKLQQTEARHIEELRKPWVKARVRIWTMAEFIEAPMEPLQTIINEMGYGRSRITEVPHMADLTGFGQFLQNLKNQGMHPYLMGDFPMNGADRDNYDKPRKPYLVR